MKHIIAPKRIGQYTICDACKRGIAQDKLGAWRHIIRRRWVDPLTPKATR